MTAQIDTLAPLRRALGLKTTPVITPGVRSATKDPAATAGLSGAKRATRTRTRLSSDEPHIPTSDPGTIEWAPQPVCRGPQVGPHNRCTHPTALPPGYTQCKGDPGCEFRPHRANGLQYCPYHQHLQWGDPRHDTEVLMGIRIR